MLLESDNERILEGLVTKCMRCVVEVTSHPDIELMMGNEILDGLILGLLGWNSTVLWKFGQTWIASAQDDCERLTATVLAVRDDEQQCCRKSPLLDQSMTQLS